ncbi:MAG: hypothetical protein GY943_38030, partial [Chloroflexi bacterium]|nr:hypothetical protein [Chloroflexota bacterium]
LSLADFSPDAVTVVLRVGQPTQELLAQLATWGDDVTMDGGNGRIRLTLAAEEKIPALASWLHKTGHTLYELSPQRQSLEELFLQVVGDENG